MPEQPTPAGQQVEVGRLTIETEQEEDGRWIAEIPKLVSVMTYGGTRKEAIARTQVLALSPPRT